MRKRQFSFGLMVALTASLLVPPPAAAARLSMIRDAEIEHIIRTWATPVFDSAGLIAEDVRIHLVRDKRINAFVAGGQNMFINTGLLTRSKHAGQVIGVIAHETGHIAGGHLARLHDRLRTASVQAILGMVLGAAAGIAAGRGDVAVAGMAAGQTFAQRDFLKYTRVQEAAADQAALRYLDANGLSARGLLEFFAVVGGEERKVVRRPDPYLRTHPLSGERVQTVRNHVETSPYSQNPLPQQFAEQHSRMRGKLIGFLADPPSRVMKNHYRENDQRLEARYARAIAYYRMPDLETALRLVDELLAEVPDDPFFHELRGQMLFENGRIRESVPEYQRAVEAYPSSGLLRLELAKALVNLDERAADQAAIAHLNEALRQEDRNATAWQSLGVAYYRTGRHGLSSLALAERSLIQGKLQEAIGMAVRAEKALPTGSPGWLRAQDIQQAAKRRRDEKRNG